MRTLITIILVLASVAAVIWVDKPMWDQILQIRSDASEVSQALSALSDLEKTRDDLLKVYDSIPQSKITRLAEFLPEKSDVGSLLINLESLTRANGIRLRRVDFSKEAAEAQLNQTQPLGQKSIQKPSSDTATITYTFAVSASYEAFRSLLNAMENNLRLVDVSDIIFNGGSGLLEFTIKAKSYFQKPLAEKSGASTLDLVNQLKQISIDTSFFDDASFLNLSSVTKPSLEGLKPGRPNPFSAGRK